MNNASGLYPENFYLLRTPVYPVEYLFELNDLLLHIDSREEGQRVIDKIREKFSDPLFIEAIFFASQELYGQLLEWLKDPVYDNKPSQKIIKSLHRYYSRMCTRCTPFGLFAGCSTGEITNSPTLLQFDMKNRIRRHVRPDAGMLAELARYLSKNRESCRYIKFRLNDMLYRRGGKLAFLESVYNGTGNSYTISALTATPYLDFIISNTGTGCYADELVEKLLAFDNSISRERYENYVHDLIACQFLISELIPNVTGEDYLNRLLHFTATSAHFSNIHSALTRARDIMQAPSPQQPYYTEVQEAIRPLRMIANTKNTLQLDAFLQFQTNNIKKQVVEEIIQTSEELWKINKVSNTYEFSDFMSRFKARYEGQAIPILTAMDADVGIGYGVAVNGNTENMPLLTGIAFQSNELQFQRTKTAFQDFVSGIYERFLEDRQAVIKLQEQEVYALMDKTDADKTENAQNTSAFVFGSILSKSCADLDNGHYHFVAAQLHNHSAGRMLGRFASGDKKLQDLLQQHNQREESINTNAIVAEVVHAPAGHALNVAVRPRVRNYEIPILCQPSVADEFVVPLQDLLVIVHNNRVILFSQKHNKEVIPRITNAFNAQRGEPIYRFLADTAAQYTRPYFQWDWFSFAGKPFLPRIEYKKFILSRARWTIPQVDATEYKSPEAMRDYFSKIKSRYEIPRYVVMVQDSDNELLLDTENPFCISQLIRVLKKRNVILLEYLGTPENCFVSADKLHFNNQVVFLLGTNKSTFPLSGYQPTLTENQHPVRSFAPGSEWLYLKVYGGNKTLDMMLPSLVKPFVERLVAGGIVDKWFFIRYNDPNSHLRIRLHCPQGNYQELLCRLNNLFAPYIERNEIDRLAIDTYKREIERYGAEYMAGSETLFYHDSVAVTNILDGIDGDAGDKVRWWAALKSVDALLNDFGYKLSRKQHLLQLLSEMFFREFATGEAGPDKKLRVSLNNKYRANAADIAQVLRNKELLDAFLYSVFEQRSKANRTLAADILYKMKQHPEGDAQLDRFLKSHIHMNVNRLFISKPRKHEMALYHFLNEYYKSQIAIQRTQAKANANV